MDLDHVALAVRSVEAATRRLSETLGYVPRTETVTNTLQKVNVRFLSKAGSPDIKLIEPSSDDSPLLAFLRKGEGLHHLCFKVESIDASLAALASVNARTLTPPQPGEAFDDHPIAFAYVGCGLNVELIDSDARRSVIETPALDRPTE